MNNGAVNDEIKRHKFHKTKIKKNRMRTERSEKSHFQGVNFIAHYVMQKKTYAVLKLQLNVLG